MNEACLLLEEGLGTTAQIDAVACSAFDIGMGPFALMNLTGPPIALHSTNYLAEQLSTPRYTGAQSLVDLVEAGVMWEIDEDTECDDESTKIISERLLGQVFAVCSQIVAEEICSMEDVDRGAKVGLRWMNGPFEIMNAIGIDEAYRMASAYADLAAFDLPPFFGIKAESEHPWEFNFVDVVQTGGIATVQLNRPEAMNALNETLVAQLGAVLDDLNADNSVTTIVLEGAGKAFVAGADVQFFVDKIRADSFSDIYDFTANGHGVLNKLENSPKTTIALTTGLALGGGLELALACDHRVGTRRSQFRFPETSIGIYPGLGGTQRTVRICGIEVARWAVLAGNFVDSKTAHAVGILTHLVEPAEVSDTVEAISALGKPENKYPGVPRDADHPVAAFANAFYSDENMAGLLNGSCPDGFDAEDRNVGRQLKSLSRVAPIAMRMANELLDGAVETGDDLDAGLALELSNLKDVFSTADALEGLSALIEGRRPGYTNS